MNFQYNCPNCHTWPKDNYVVNGRMFPIIWNERSVSIAGISGKVWSEQHVCQNCNTTFEISNASF